MTRWLAIIGLVPFAATQAHAAAVLESGFPIPKAEQPVRPSLNFRLVQDPIEDPRPVHNSGMIAHTEVAPGATLGIGIFKTAPRKLGSGDWRTDGKSPSSRKAAVTFRMKF